MISIQWLRWCLIALVVCLFTVGCGDSNQEETTSYMDSEPTVQGEVPTVVDLTVLSPNRDVVWEQGAVYVIQWNVSHNMGTYVKIDLFKNAEFQQTGDFSRRVAGFAHGGNIGHAQPDPARHHLYDGPRGEERRSGHCRN